MNKGFFNSIIFLFVGALTNIHGAANNPQEQELVTLEALSDYTLVEIITQTIPHYSAMPDKCDMVAWFGVTLAEILSKRQICRRFKNILTIETIFRILKMRGYNCPKYACDMLKQEMERVQRMDYLCGRNLLAIPGTSLPVFNFVIRSMSSTENTISLADRLIAIGFNVNVQSANSGETPLMIAACAKNAAVVEALLKRGANPNIKDMIGHTALNYLFGRIFASTEDRDYATRNIMHCEKSMKIIKLLLAKGARVEDSNLSQAQLKIVEEARQRKEPESDFTRFWAEVKFGADEETSPEYIRKSLITIPSEKHKSKPCTIQ